MISSPEKVLSALKKDTYDNVYLLQGEEPYYIDLLSDYIEQHALDETAKGFNQIILYGKDVEIRDILTQARRFPMMSERQTVIVKEAQDIKDFNKEDTQNLLEEYLKQPVPTTILVFCYKYKTFDKRKKIWKVIEKGSNVVESKRLYDNQVPDWTINYVRGSGNTIEDKAAYMLSENIGNNLQRLVNEIDKILINFKESVNITPELVDKYVGINKDYNSFELQRAIAQKDLVKANRIVNYFGDNPRGNPLLPVLAVLFSFFSKLLILHENQGMNPKELASKLRVSPFFVKEYIQASRQYSLQVVMRNIHHLSNADLSFKGINTSGISERQLLRELIFKLMH